MGFIVPPRTTRFVISSSTCTCLLMILENPPMSWDTTITVVSFERAFNLS